MKRVLLLSVLALTLFSSCRHKELCYDHNHNLHEVRVEFDWSEEPQADPETMSLYIFDSKGVYYTQYQFSGGAGGRITIPEGRYGMIALNDDSDTEFVNSSDTFSDFSITTGQTSLLSTFFFLSRASSAPRAAGTEDEAVRRYPGSRLWSDKAEGIEIYEDCTLTFIPRKKVCSVSVEIVNVTNIEHITGLSAALSSVASSIRLGVDKAGSDKVTHPFDIAANDAKNTLSGQLQIFGHCPDSPGTHALTVYMTLSDGKAYYHTYDVSSQMEDAPDQKNITIRLNGLSVPEPIDIGGGTSPSVDSWENIEIDLPMF